MLGCFWHGDGSAVALVAIKQRTISLRIALENDLLMGCFRHGDRSAVALVLVA